MKLFNSINKNYILFLIITVFLLTPALLLNNILFPGDEINVSGYNLKTLDKCIDKNNFELSNKSTNITNINYVDIILFIYLLRNNGVLSTKFKRNTAKVRFNCGIVPWSYIRFGDNRV